MINNVLDLLRSDGSIVVNKRLAKEIGLVEAVIYSELASLYKYWSDRGELVDGEWFYCTFPNLEKNTTIPERTARRKVTELEKLGLIESDLRGLPAKKHYRITNKILEVLGLVPNKDGQNGRTDNSSNSEVKNDEKQHSDQVGQNGRTRTDKMAELDQTKWPTNNTKLNNTNKNNDLLTIVNLQETEIITDIEQFKKIFTEVCNSFYTVFAVDRWSKKQWNTLIEKFVAETIDSDRFKDIPIGKMKGYAFKAIENMSKHVDFRKGTYNQRENMSEDLPFYNWLEQ